MILFSIRNSSLSEICLAIWRGTGSWIFWFSKLCLTWMFWKKGIRRRVCLCLLNHCDCLDRAYTMFMGHSWNAPVLLRNCLESEAHFLNGIGCLGRPAEHYSEITWKANRRQVLWDLVGIHISIISDKPVSVNRGVLHVLLFCLFYFSGLVIGMNRNPLLNPTENVFTKKQTSPWIGSRRVESIPSPEKSCVISWRSSWCIPYGRLRQNSSPPSVELGRQSTPCCIQVQGPHT